MKFLCSRCPAEIRPEIASVKPDEVSHGLCHTCFLRAVEEAGVITTEEKAELAEIRSRQG